MLNRSGLLEAFYQLTGSCHSIWNWRLDTGLAIRESDCPHPDLFFRLFNEQMRKDLFAHMEPLEGERAYHAPVVILIQAMLYFVVAFEEEEGRVTMVYCKGPFFSGSNYARETRHLIAHYRFDEEERRLLTSAMATLPVLTGAEAISYAQMLHFCLHGERIDSAMVMTELYQLGNGSRVREDVNQFDKSSRGYEVEQELLRRVKDGDMSVSRLLAEMNNNPARVTKNVPGNMLQLRQSTHILLTLVSRAAVEGGMVQRTSFSLVTDYRARIDACRSIGELALLSNDMILDYARSRGKAVCHLQPCHPPMLRVYCHTPAGKTRAQ